jgi:micrococcal nuclease
METALVIRVIDGDTIELLDGRRVRYLRIDTPEIGERYYEEASDRNRELVGGKTVDLQRGNRAEERYSWVLLQLEDYAKLSKQGIWGL